MNIDSLLENKTALLNSAGLASSRLDCLVLLEDAIGKDRSWILAHPDFTVQGRTLYSLEQKLARRARHEPLSYIRCKSEFYGREFKVNTHTLEPRPETETMIDLLKKLPEPLMHQDGPGASRVLVDVGSGSGCLAITAKLEFPYIDVLGTDIDANCLRVARLNANIHKTKITFFKCDLIARFEKTKHQQPNVILANLPYVPDSRTINQAAMYEPKHAIFGGDDGLDLYRRLFRQIQSLPHPPKYVLTESLPTQHPLLAKIAEQANYGLKEEQDFIQVFLNGD